MKFKARYSFLYCSTVILLLNFSSALAQPKQAANHQFSLTGGYSFNSVKFLGKTHNSQTQIISIGFQQEILTLPKNRTLWYTTDIIPFLHYQYPKRDDGWRIHQRSGFGFSPIGFSLTEENGKILSPYIQTTGGVIYMENHFPTDRARHINFTFDVALGANIQLNSFMMVSAGYKFHHISNAETGKENPGLDSNFLYLTLIIK